MAGLVGVFFWGSGSWILRTIEASAATIAMWRMALGVPVMWAAAWWYAQLPDRRMWRAAAIPGLLFGVSMPLGFEATLTTSIANASLIGALTPVVILLGAGRLIGERTDRSKIPAALVAIGGMTVVLLAGSDTTGASLRGDLAAVANLAAWVAYFLMTKARRDSGVGSWGYLAAVFAIGFPVTAVWSLAAGFEATDVAGVEWFAVIAMALLPGLVGHGLYTWSMQTLPAQVSALLSLVTPVVATTGAWFLFGERLSLLQLGGGALALGGVAKVVALHRSNAPHRDDHPVGTPPVSGSRQG
jgi:drug/metabolite transporter (DMT)-like permease